VLKQKNTISQIAPQFYQNYFSFIVVQHKGHHQNIREKETINITIILNELPSIVVKATKVFRNIEQCHFI
jgi:hypothetical protein